jgi:hypothetical protein
VETSPTVRAANLVSSAKMENEQSVLVSDELPGVSQ